MSRIKIFITLLFLLVLLSESSICQPLNSNDLNFGFISMGIEQPAPAKRIDFGIGLGFSSHLKDNSTYTDYSENTLYYSVESPSIGHNFSGNFTILFLGRYFLTPNFAVGLIYSQQSLNESESIFSLEGLSPTGELDLTGKGFFINFFPAIQFISESKTTIKAGLIYKSYSGSGTFQSNQVKYKNQIVSSYTYTLKPGFAPFLTAGLEFSLSKRVSLNLEIFGEFASTSFKTLKVDQINFDSFGTSIISDNQIGMRISLLGGFEL